MRRPEESPEADRLADAAADAFDDGRFEEALSRADEAIARAPRSVPALHVRAAALAALDRTDEAAEAYDRALSAGKDDLDVLLGAAEFFAGATDDGDPDRALVERGIEIARKGAKLARRSGDREIAAELACIEGAALNDLGRPAEALERLEEAREGLPGSVDVLLEKGFALYELCRFGEARKALLAAEAIGRDDPWVQHHLGLVAERQGDEEEARRRFSRARKLSPDDFPKPIALSQAAFDAAVEDALKSVPEPVRRYLSNVAITVEDLPSDADLRASDPPLSPAILGLFRGAPYGQKASMDPWSHFPSSIALFQKNLERFARSRRELIEEIRVTLVHEVGHFLGLDEEELWERGLD